MSETVPLRRIGVKSVFDEARECIDEWEKAEAEPEARRICMVLDGHTDVVMSIAGPAMKPTDAAGLFFTAARMAVE